LFRYEIQNGGGHLGFPIGIENRNFVEDLPMIIPGKFGFNCPRNDHWKVLYKVSVFYADRKSKMAATTGHSINTGPYGENTEICSSLKLQRLSRACIVHMVITRTNWSYVKTMSCNGSHLGIPINIKRASGLNFKSLSI
jgi:hypothetical protein